MKGLFVFALVFVLFSRVLAAQEAGPAQEIERPEGAGEPSRIDLIRFYDSELFQWNFSMMGGLVLHYQYQTSVPSWNIGPGMKAALFSFPETKELAQSYLRLNGIGKIFTYSGLAVILTGSLVPLMVSDLWKVSEGDISIGSKIVLGGSIGGLLMTLTGGILSSLAQEDLFQAVNAYNRLKFAGYK